MNKLNAIVLAGTHTDKSKLIYGQNKAFAKINNKPLIVNSLEAVKKAEYIGEILIVGPRRKLEERLEKKTIKDIPIIEESKAPTESRRFIENAGRAYDILSPNGEKTLFVPCDLPFISSKTIKDFILKCNNYNAAFYFALINAENIPSDLDPFKKSAKFHLKGKGHYRTANMVLFEGLKIKDYSKNRESLEAQISKAFPKRRATSIYAKSRLYWFIFKNYPIEILKYLTNQLTEENIESALKNKLDLSFKLIETQDLRAGIDIDYTEEYEFIKDNYDKIKTYLQS